MLSTPAMFGCSDASHASVCVGIDDTSAARSVTDMVFPFFEVLRLACLVRVLKRGQESNLHVEHLRRSGRHWPLLVGGVSPRSSCPGLSTRMVARQGVEPYRASPTLFRRSYPEPYWRDVRCGRAGYLSGAARPYVPTRLNEWCTSVVWVVGPGHYRAEALRARRARSRARPTREARGVRSVGLDTGREPRAGSRTCRPRSRSRGRSDTTPSSARAGGAARLRAASVERRPVGFVCVAFCPFRKAERTTAVVTLTPRYVRSQALRQRPRLSGMAQVVVADDRGQEVYSSHRAPSRWPVAARVTARGLESPVMWLKRSAH